MQAVVFVCDLWICNTCQQRTWLSICMMACVADCYVFSSVLHVPVEHPT